MNKEIGIPIKGKYYDLVRTPHGHTPVSKVRFWKVFPIPIREVRSYNYYHCPLCGRPSFFKINGACQYCWGYAYECYDHESFGRFEQRNRKIERRNYFRRLWKTFENLLLPILILTHRAWYVKSDRLHWSEAYEGYPYDDWDRDY